MCTNLAGESAERATGLTRKELEHARIEVVESGTPQQGEVKTRVSGKLGGWTFTRAWYYWIAEGGRMPIESARDLWNDPLGKDDVRVGGDCGCPSPDEYGARSGFVTSYHVDSVAGLRLLADAIRRMEGIQ